MRKLLVHSLIMLLLVSCEKISDKPADTFLTGSGVFIINEGNFRGGNGSLSYYSYDSSRIYNDLFSGINGRPLGDVPNSIKINGDYAYIVVNNSGKIEVINRHTLESVGTINNLVSPRNIQFLNSTKAYVTSMYSDFVTIINLTDNSIAGTINLRRSSEDIIISGNRAFITCWVNGKEIMVVNTDNNKVVDSVEVGIEPESMALDRNNKLWVLCNGGWTREHYAKLIALNTVTLQIEKEYIFPSKEKSPSCLQISGNKETLYYLEKGVQKMNISASVLPTVPIISESGHYFYKMGIDPVNNNIFITDAVDYQQRGYLMYYKSDGTFISEVLADIIPGNLCFKN